MKVFEGRKKVILIILILGIAGFLVWWFFFKAPTPDELAELATKKDFEKTNKLDKLNDPYFNEVKGWYLEPNKGLIFSNIMSKGAKYMTDKERLKAWRKLKAS